MICIPYASDIELGPGILNITPLEETSDSTISTVEVSGGTISWANTASFDTGWAADISRAEAYGVIGHYDTIIDDLMARIKKLEDALTIMGVEISEDQIEELL